MSLVKSIVKNKTGNNQQIQPPPPNPINDFLLYESSDYILLESGGNVLKESA